MVKQGMSGYKDFVSLASRADDLRRKNMYCAALEIYWEIVDRFGGDADLLAAVSACYFFLSDYEKYFAWIEKAVELAPEVARLRAGLAEAYELGLHDYEKAAEEFRLAITLNPYNAEVLYNSGGQYGCPESEMPLAEAIERYERAIGLDPEHPHYRIGLGELYLEAGRRPDAMREWLRALMCPAVPPPWPANFAENAAARMEKAFHKRKPFAALRMAESERSTSVAQESADSTMSVPAGEAWERLSEDNRRQLVKLLLDAAAKRRERQYERAIAIYGMVIDRFGANVPLLLAIGDGHISMAQEKGAKGVGDRSEAVAWMREALALEPTNGRLHARLAQSLGLDPGKWHLAVDQYRRALKLSPYDLWALVKAASLRDVAGDIVELGEAVVWMERAAWLEPIVPDYHVRLGDLYHEAGREDDAQREWVKALLCPRLLDAETSRDVRQKLGMSVPE